MIDGRWLRVIFRALLVSLTASAVAQSAQAQGVKLQDVSYRFNWTFIGSYAPIYLGIEKGFFSKRGINLNAQLGKGSVGTANTVANGSDDFGYLDMGAVARLVDKGLPIKCVAQLRQKTTMALLSLEKNNIKTPKDLIGRKISYTPGDSNSLLFPAFLKATGIKLEQLKIEGIDPSIYLKALVAGQVDVTMGYLDSEGFILENQGQKINAMMFSDFGVNVVQNCLVTSNKMIQEKPDLVKRVVAGFIESYAYGETHVDEAVTLAHKLFPTIDEKLTRKQLAFLPSVFGDSVKKGKPIGWVDPQVWVQTLSLLHQYAGIANTDPSRYYTNDFIPASP
jgi:ABC-type nitrate/sulfonate/bicarbonate transport system substrate-binding protein